jgi:hypothetical protein
MENLTIRIVLAISFFVLMLFSGIWLRTKGKPYNKLIFALHKIMTILTILFVARYIILLKNSVEMMQLIITLFWISVAFFAISFISGALLSFEKPMPDALNKLHRLSALLVTILGGVTVYLILR